MKTVVLTLLLALPLKAGQTSTTTVYGGQRYHNCPPVGMVCVRDPDLTVDNNSKEPVLVVYRHKRITVRPWARMELNETR